MKLPDTKTIIILGLVIVLAVSGFFHVEQNDLADAYRLEKEQAQRHIKKQIDSMNHVAIRKDEQLLKLMRELSGANMETQAAKQETANYRWKYEQIKIRLHASDSERADALKRLYPN